MSVENDSFFKRWGRRIKGAVVRVKSKLSATFLSRRVGFKEYHRKATKLSEKYSRMVRTKTNGRR